MNWIKLKKYCEISGDTAEAVRNRRKKGVWADGKHSKIGPDGKIWVNPMEVDKWVDNYQHTQRA